MIYVIIAEGSKSVTLFEADTGGACTQRQCIRSGIPTVTNPCMTGPSRFRDPDGCTKDMAAAFMAADVITDVNTDAGNSSPL